jgi:hypothetical protein
MSLLIAITQQLPVIPATAGLHQGFLSDPNEEKNITFLDREIVAFVTAEPAPTSHLWAHVRRFPLSLRDNKATCSSARSP